jgi:hypothetical protein
VQLTCILNERYALIVRTCQIIFIHFIPHGKNSSQSLLRGKAVLIDISLPNFGKILLVINKCDMHMCDFKLEIQTFNFQFIFWYDVFKEKVFFPYQSIFSSKNKSKITNSYTHYRRCLLAALCLEQLSTTELLGVSVSVGSFRFSKGKNKIWTIVIH